MAFKQNLKSLVKKLTGVHLIRTLPHGLDLFSDVRARLPGMSVKVVLDVGANVGQSARRFRAEWPDAEIYCFEPVPSSYEILKRELGPDTRVRCLCMALGAAKGKVLMALCDQSDMNKVEKDHGCRIDGARPLGRCSVNMDTLDGVCEQLNVSEINFLKIDTEGSDLDVLIGAERILSEQRADLVQVEAGMHPSNKHHVPFSAFCSHLEKHQYRLFGVYEQVPEWSTNEPFLRRANLVFVSLPASKRCSRASIKTT